MSAELPKKNCIAVVFCCRGSSEKTQALEQKLYKQQEELTELHRKTGHVSACNLLAYLKL